MVPMCSYLMLNFSCACNTQQPTWCLYVSTSCSDLAVQQPTWYLCVPTSCSICCACSTLQPTWCLYVSTSCSDSAVQQPTWCLYVPTSCSISVVHVVRNNPHGTHVFIVGSSSSSLVLLLLHCFFIFFFSVMCRCLMRQVWLLKPRQGCPQSLTALTPMAAG